MFDLKVLVGADIGPGRQDGLGRCAIRILAEGRTQNRDARLRPSNQRRTARRHGATTISGPTVPMSRWLPAPWAGGSVVPQQRPRSLPIM